MIDVSIIILTYNSLLRKIVKTLDSLVNQEKVNIEIIISDDGSQQKYQQEIESYFIDKHFSNYKLLLWSQNQGTVANCLAGIKQAQGVMTKFISPGDYLKNNTVLRKWLDYIETNNAKWSFSDAIYYTEEQDQAKRLSETTYPQNIKPYIKRDDEQVRWNYVVLDDVAVGAATIGDTRLFTEYLEILKQVGVKYGEDNIYRLLMFDNIIGLYYPRETVYYEFGCGISTSRNKEWDALLKRDEDIINSLIVSSTNSDHFQQKMMERIKWKKQGKKRFFIEGYVSIRLKKHLYSRKSSVKERDR